MEMYIDYKGIKGKRRSLASIVDDLKVNVIPCHRAIQDCKACQWFMNL